MRSLFALMIVCAAMFVAGCGGDTSAPSTTTTTPSATETETTEPATTDGTAAPAEGATQ